METKIKNLGKLKREIAITVSKEIIQEAASKVYQDLKNRVSIKGFRKGKFPKNLMEKRFQENMEVSIKEKIIPECLNQSVQKNAIKIATSPKIDSGKIEKDQPFSFTAKFEVFPDFQLPKWKEIIKIKKFENKPQKQEIENYTMLTTLQNYEYKEKTTAIQDKDKVELQMDIEEIAGKKEQKNITILYYVGSNEISEKLDKALLKMKKDQTKEVDFTVSAYSLSQDIAGKKIKAKIKVLSIAQRVEQPKNKEFYQKISSETTDEKSLLQFCEKSLKNLRARQNENKEKDMIRDAIIKNTDFDVPQELVDSNLKQMENQPDKNPKTDKKEQQASIAGSLRYQLVLAKIIEEEKIATTKEEVTETITQLALSYKVDPRELIGSEQGKNLINSVRSQLEQEKSLAFIRKNI
jgi:trigger factor